ncbi:MAG: CotH kinase family protein [Prevotella sp.]|nr:CotH kinase family protein [Prevotella sp.]
MMNSKMIRIVFLMLLQLSALSALADGGSKLTGTVIGTTETVDYSTFQKSTTANTREMAFDGNLNTCFASWERSYTWTGLDLGSKHVITRVGWSPRNDSQGEKRVVLGVFEGANREDFMDALPIYVITEKGTIGQMSYADVNCSAGFRYVRYIGPSDARCNIAELEFYGYEGAGDNSHLYQLTNLPTVSIHTKDGVIPYDKETDIASQITIISDDGQTLMSEPGGVRERGNFSRTFPKKPYRIKFDKKQRVLDAPAKAKKWTLINNYGDKTLMRNLLAFELSRRMGMPYTPYGTAVDVLLNGEYKGCYQLCDQVEVNPGRVEITEMTPDDVSGSALTGGYFFEIDAYAYEEASMFYSAQGNPVTIKSPDEDEITEEQTKYIKNYFNKMESQWRSILDLNTFLRHFLVGELSGNTDTYWSVYMYKDRDDDLVYTGPVWDFDLAFENDSRTYPIMDKGDYIYRSGGSCAGNMKSFVDRIVVNDTKARAQLLEIWDEVRRAGLTEEYMTDYIDKMEQKLQQSQTLNFMRWPIMNDYVHQNPHIWGSYKAEVQNVRRYMKERIAWMDNKLGYQFDPSAISPTIITTSKSQNTSVYLPDGRRCGNSLENLPAGLYITGGRKVVVR